MFFASEIAHFVHERCGGSVDAPCFPIPSPHRLSKNLASARAISAKPIWPARRWGGRIPAKFRGQSGMGGREQNPRRIYPRSFPCTGTTLRGAPQGLRAPSTSKTAAYREE